jgi:hypothetical protein
MVAILLPVHLEDERTTSFLQQLENLKRLTGDLVEWLEPQSIRDRVPEGTSAVVVPDMSGLAYRLTEAFRAIEPPILVITSEFGTVSMWDWEIRDFLRRRDIKTIAPTSLQEFHDICRALATKQTLTSSTMLAYQDDLGAGKQPDIFKRFYWWEDSCADDMQAAFGVKIERRSFRELAARADAVSDARVEQAWSKFRGKVPISGLSERGRADALRLYVALADELDETPGVIAAGINCLNESDTSNTTPCLAWNLLFEERGLMWGCEADLTSMMTKYLAYQSLRVPVMMSNLYPFLMGDAALKHEKIPYFPTVEEPQNHILAAHCGYFGVVPQSFATDWTLKRRVLEIVNQNANAIDARFAEGPTTILKLASTMDAIVMTPAVLTGYTQYENSDCLNGALLRVQDGYRLVENLPSHHAVLATGDLTRRLAVVADIFGLAVQEV